MLFSLTKFQIEASKNLIMVIEKIVKILSKEKKILFAYLFGSYLENRKYAKDIDIAIFVKGKASKDFERKLARKLSNEVKKDIDIFILNKVPLIFLLQIFKNSKLIFSRDEKKRIEFETRKLREVQDFNEFMKVYDKMRFKRYGIR